MRITAHSALYRYCIVLAILLSVLAACSDNSASDNYGSSHIHPLDEHFDEKYRDDLPGLMERHYIRVLTTFNRTNFFIAGAELYGFEYSLLKDYEKHLNKKRSRRQLQVVLEFIPVTRDRLIPALNEGLGDIAAAGLTVTPGRLEEVNFTRPYLSGIDEVVVTHRSVDDINNVKDLAGRNVYVRKSSSYYNSLLDLNNKLSSLGLKNVRIKALDETLETEDVLEMVNAGALDITIADSHVASIWSEVYKDIRILENVMVRNDADIAWMVRKDNPRLKASLDVFIKSRRQGTLHGNIYFNRYYKDSKWIKNPLELASARDQLEAIGHIRKYADQYGFDWLLLLALGYQESRLNQNKRSQQGAIGIMQIKRSTAAGKAVGIKDIQKIENNIHAGIKYLAHLRDTYYDEPALSERDRIRFALAAYNAGPTNVARMRTQAKKMGLDPNKWFRNVEIASLRVVSSEPVRYVSNINKYYVAYRLFYGNENSN
ncbi:MAG: lytic transglycosylase F [Nitrospirota bacterium]|nr:MAG: lytic transglycosylase F [Nitrospirota bacterium]